MADADRETARREKALLRVCHVRVTHDELSADDLCRVVGDDGAGATATFLGTTRDNFKGKRVTRLEYEGYVDMAEQELRRVCYAAAAQWNLIGAAIEHRIGVVPVRQCSVIIAVSSAHRAEALHACEFMINRLKATVPIWKKEWYEGETSAWKENQEWRDAQQLAQKVDGAGTGHQEGPGKDGDGAIGAA